MSKKTLDLDAGMARLEAIYLRHIADWLERVANQADMTGFTTVAPCTQTEVWPFTQARITP